MEMVEDKSFSGLIMSHLKSACQREISSVLNQFEQVTIEQYTSADKVLKCQLFLNLIGDISRF